MKSNVEICRKLNGKPTIIGQQAVCGLNFFVFIRSISIMTNMLWLFDRNNRYLNMKKVGFVKRYRLKIRLSWHIISLVVSQWKVKTKRIDFEGKWNENLDWSLIRRVFIRARQQFACQIKDFDSKNFDIQIIEVKFFHFFLVFHSKTNENFSRFYSISMIYVKIPITSVNIARNWSH